MGDFGKWLQSLGKTDPFVVINNKLDNLDFDQEFNALDLKLGEANHLWGFNDATLLSYANAAYQHIHMPGYIYPDDCSVITVTPDAAANTFGPYVEVVPAGMYGITTPFDCHWVTVTNISATGVYIVEFRIVSDSDLQQEENYLTAFSVSRGSNFDRSTQVSVQMPAIGGGKRVGARAKQSGTGVANISFNIHYHEYDFVE